VSRRGSFWIGLSAGGVLLLAAGLRYERFLSLPILVNLVSDHAVVGIAAVGMTFVILAGGIDLSVGAVMSLSSVSIAVAIMHRQWPVPLAMAGGALLGAVLGAVMGCLVHFGRLKPFIVTLAGMFFARGLGFLIHLESIGIRHPAHAALASWGVPFGEEVFLPVPAVVFLGVVLVAGYVCRFTPFGRHVYAVGGREEAARLTGVPVGAVKVAVYGVSGLCSGLAGGVLTLYLSSGSHVEGIGLELDAIAAVVVGGTLLSGGVGGIPETVVGVLIVGLILTVITTYEGMASSGLTSVAIGGLLLVFVLLQKLLLRRVGR
jgi:simple sugar transport system permease protein